MSRIAFIGLGAMGGPMAGNLVTAGHDVIGFDLAPALCVQAKKNGVEIAAYFIAISEDPADAVAAMAGRFGVPAEVLAEHPHALIGSVPEICEKLEQRRSELGVSYINVAQRSMEAFAPVVARLAGR